MIKELEDGVYKVKGYLELKSTSDEDAIDKLKERYKDAPETVYISAPYEGDVILAFKADEVVRVGTESEVNDFNGAFAVPCKGFDTVVVALGND